MIGHVPREPRPPSVTPYTDVDAGAPAPFVRSAPAAGDGAAGALGAAAGDEVADEGAGADDVVVVVVDPEEPHVHRG